MNAIYLNSFLAPSEAVQWQLETLAAKNAKLANSETEAKQVIIHLLAKASNARRFNPSAALDVKDQGKFCDASDVLLGLLGYDEYSRFMERVNPLPL